MLRAFFTPALRFKQFYRIDPKSCLLRSGNLLYVSHLSVSQPCRVRGAQLNKSYLAWNNNPNFNLLFFSGST